MTAAEPAGVSTGVTYALSLSEADVGARVVIRRRLPGGGYGDLLGELLSWSSTVRVRDRHGAEHGVDRSDVVAGKRVPPPPARPARR